MDTISTQELWTENLFDESPRYRQKIFLRPDLRQKIKDFGNLESVEVLHTSYQSVQKPARSPYELCAMLTMHGLFKNPCYNTSFS